MANYCIDPDVLQPFLPAKTELDFFKGNTYVSLVGFMFLNTKLLGYKIPFHINFEEVNLRFYVRYRDNGQWKRGTVFIKEIVPKPAITLVANTVYHEKYDTKLMQHSIEAKTDELFLSYRFKHQGRWNRIEATVENKAAPLIAGSEEEFIAEHYFGYSRYNNETTFEYTVQHPSWKIFPVKQYLIDCDFKSVYGDRFAGLQNAQPDSLFVAAGSDVAILKKKKL